MISDSRFRSQSSHFLNTLLQISNQVITYYFFQSPAQSKPYKMSRHITELYTFVYQSCTSKPSNDDKMLQIFKKALQQHINKHLVFIQNSVRDNNFIMIYNLIWKSYTSYTLLLSKRIFAYLNRYYLPANDLETLNQIGLNLFAKQILNDNFMRFAIAAYSTDLQKMRKNKIINHSQLLKFTQSMTILDNSKFFPIFKEIYMLQATKYYEDAFNKNSNNQPMAYLNFVNNQLFFQKLLCQKCICFTNLQQINLQNLFTAALIKKYTPIFCRQAYGFTYLLRNRKIQQLKLITDIYKKGEGFEDLKKHVYQFILQEGNIKLNLKSQQANSQQFITCYSNFYNEYNTIINQGFNKIVDIQNSFKAAIQKLLIKYDRITQDLFKIVRNNLDQGKFETVEQQIIQIFQKLPYKDQFVNLYRKSLQKKIISGSFIYLIQKKFITTLNKLCGSDATAELDKIMEDCIQSMPKNLPMISDNFNVKVISLHFWEKKFEDQISLNLTLIQPLASVWSKFQTVYAQFFPKRRLILLPYETKMTLKVKFSNKQTILKCSLIQACIIFFIANNAHKKLREQNIITGLTLEKTFLQRFAEQFPSIINVDSDNQYHFNWNFQTVDSFVDLDSKVQQEKKVTRHIKQDRDILIQCAIVKIMKKVKQMQFEDLVYEVTHAIKLFKPHPSVIKSGIEALKKKQIVEEVQIGKIKYKQ